MTLITNDTTHDAGPDEAEVAAFADEVFDRLLGAFDVYAMSIGVQLGWYRALADGAGTTSADLAQRTDTDERYAREWLEHQALAGIVTVEDATSPPAERRYRLRRAAATVLADADDLSYLAPFTTFVTSLGANLDHLLEAFRSGGGFGWHQHGDGPRRSQSAANRPLFLRLLGHEYLASLPRVDAALRSGGRVADIGCGFGWSAIGVALAYPDCRVDGFDVDGPSIEEARANAAEAGVADRVRFHHVDAGSASVDGTYDLVMALECIHDLADPVSVLATMRSMAAAEGTVLVMDERVGDAFTGEPDDVERMFYGFSLLCCLADGRNAAESVATGTVMRAPTLEGYARDAGFAGLTVLPIENDFFRFYELTR